MPSQIKLHHIQQARESIRGEIRPSPLIWSPHLSRRLGAEVLLKLENLQETGSFKVRGAYHRLLHLSEPEKAKGVITASAGNHAQGVAWASRKLGICATIVMPEDVSIKKLEAVREYDPEIILHGTQFSDAVSRALALSRESGQIFIPGFDDPDVIAGQGTIGLELEEVLAGDVAVVASIGGGGLISGVAAAVKGLHPGAGVIGVQAKHCPSAIRSLQEGRPVSVAVGPTIADGIAVSRPGDLNFAAIQEHVDEVVAVDEEDMAGAILTLLEKANLIVEGAGAAPLAALMDGKHAVRAERYILIISGGNIEINTIDRILQRGSIRMGRLIRVEVNIADTPGSLWKLLGVVAEERANILHIVHDRLDLDNPLGVSRVVLNLETRGHDHGGEIMRRLEQGGYSVRQIF